METVVLIFIGFVAIITIFGFVFGMTMFFNPKLRAKFMSKEVAARKYMMDQSKEDLRSISDSMAYATKDGIKTTARAIKEGFVEENIYCKYCGSYIDKDSKFCKKCGKEQ